MLTENLGQDSRRTDAVNGDSPEARVIRDVVSRLIHFHIKLDSVDLRNGIEALLRVWGTE